jgi:uncharacterized protein (DUF433 family)
MNETWKPIPGFAGYEASDHGSIRSVDRINFYGRKLRGTVLTPWLDTNGRHQVGFSIDGHVTSHQVHRLVLLAHIGPCPAGHECCHYDDNAQNNHLSNLRWDTKKANNLDKIRNGKTNRGERATYSKLTEAKVIEIRKDERTIAAIAKSYGVSHGAIVGAIYGANWRHVPKTPDDVTRKIGRGAGDMAPNTKVDSATVLKIRADNRSQATIAADYGIAQTTVSAIKRGKTWTSV